MHSFLHDKSFSRRSSIVRTFIEECWNFKDQECILESFTKNCLHKKSMNTCIGVECLIRDDHDWFVTFPDFCVTIQSIEEYQNVVVCNVIAKGTHLQEYKSTNQDKKSVLSVSELFTSMANVAPTGNHFDIPGRVISTFDGSKISHIIIDSDLFELSRQLGLDVFRATNEKKSTDVPFSLESINEALGTALSMREVECLSLAICGFSAKHMAKILAISYRTIEAHLNHAYQKLGCSGKQQLLEFFHENRLLSLWLEVGKRVLEHYSKKTGHALERGGVGLCRNAKLL